MTEFEQSSDTGASTGSMSGHDHTPEIGTHDHADPGTSGLEDLLESRPAIELRFRAQGGGYARAIEVARYMGLSIEDYLFQCIVEGHKVLKREMDADLELPEWMRKRSQKTSN